MEFKTCCPICGGPEITRCKCSKASRICPVGHQWYFDKDVIRLGDGHKIEGEIFQGPFAIPTFRVVSDINTRCKCGKPGLEGLYPNGYMCCEDDHTPFKPLKSFRNEAIPEETRNALKLAYDAVRSEESDEYLAWTLFRNSLMEL